MLSRDEDKMNRELPHFISELLKSANLPKNELAIFHALNKLLPILQERDNFEKNETPLIGSIPEWYFDLIKLLDDLCQQGYSDATKIN